MKAPMIPVLILLAALSATMVSGTADRDARVSAPTEQGLPDPEEKTTAVSLLTMSEEQAHALTPMNREIRVLLLRERDTIASLEMNLGEIKDRMEAIRIQKMIGYHKARTEVAVMEVQAKFAEQAGRHEQAAEIRQALTGMKARLEVRLAETGGSR